MSAEQEERGRAPARPSNPPRPGSEPPLSLERELPRKIVVIGDLNGQGTMLVRLLQGLKLIRKDLSWCGGATVLIQMGDIPNRGPEPRRAMDLVLGLRDQAREVGGDVVWLLGNHEVLSTLAHEAYVTAEEYLEFASEDELEGYFHERSRFQFQFLGAPRADGRVPPMGGVLKAWEEANAPGKDEYRRSMGKDGYYGKIIRRLPLAMRFGEILFVHGGLSTKWAEHGILGLERLRHAAWNERPTSYEQLDPHSILRDPLGPLWNRVYCMASAAKVGTELRESLNLTGARRMIVGHTRTDAVPDGVVGRPLVRHGGRVIMADVGLGEPGDGGSALVIERRRVEVWYPGGAKSRLVDLGSTAARRR